MRRISPHVISLCVLLALAACDKSNVPQRDSPDRTNAGHATATQAPPPTAREAEMPAPPIAQWPTYHGETSLNGVANVAFPDALAQAWKFDAGSAIANPAVADKSFICLTNDQGAIFVLDKDGNLVWTKSFTEPIGDGTKSRTVYFDAPLLLIDSVLIAGSANGTMYAFDVRSGDIRWQRKLGISILGTPNVADVNVDGAAQRRLFVIDESGGGLQSLDFATGKPLWAGDAIARCDGSPAATGRFVVYGSCAAALHVFSAADGKLLRETPLDEDSQVAGGVVLLDNLIYSGSRSGMVVCADPETAGRIWTNKDCEGEVFATPAVDAGYVVFGANDNMLYALDRATGTLKWKQELGSTPSSAAIARDKIVVTAGGDLYLLKLADGATLWKISISDAVTAPLIAGSLVLVGADDGSLTAFTGRETAAS